MNTSSLSTWRRLVRNKVFSARGQRIRSGKGRHHDPLAAVERLEDRTLLSAGDLDFSFSSDGKTTIDHASLALDQDFLIDPPHSDTPDTPSTIIDLGGYLTDPVGTQDAIGLQSLETSQSSDPGGFTQLITSGETEPNNTPATAQVVTGFGTGPGEDSQAQITGTQTFDNSIAIVNVPSEPGDSIGTAFDTNLVTGDFTLFQGMTIGDGAHGTTTGDFDFFSINAAAGQELFIEVDTSSDFGNTPSGLDSIVGIYDSAGTLLYYNDDGSIFFANGEFVDSSARFVTPEAGTYYVAVGGWFSGVPADLPNDPTTAGSSPAGVGSNGTYQLLVSLENGDQDFYSVELEAGDILGASTVSAGFNVVSIRAPDGSEMMGSYFDLSPNYSGGSPLPGGGESASIVAPVSGTYTVGVSSGNGAYTLNLEAFRPVAEQQAAFSRQVLFLDFDGETLNPSIFGGVNADRTLSPLDTFLAGWGLTSGDESAVIDAIITQVVDVLATDVGGVSGSGLNGEFFVTGNNGEFAIEILNSRDHADFFGQYENVSRVVIGGTIAELGIATLGIADSIDVGNFDMSETAVVLLDILSGSVGSGGGDDINALPGVNAGNIIDAIGAVVGQITAHEAGHFFGAFHTENTNDVPNTQDRGGDGVADEAGVGSDGIFGTADDVSPTFGSDTFTVAERISGTEDTRNLLAFGLSTGVNAGDYFDFVTGTLHVSGTTDDGTADTYRLVQNGSNLEVFVNGISQGATALSLITEIQLHGSNDDDAFEVDFSGGVFNIPITITGGGQGTGGDSLEITGGTFSSTTFNYLTSTNPPEGNDGNIQFTGLTNASIAYTGLEPVLTDSDLGTNVTFNLTTGVDLATLRGDIQDADAAVELILDSTNGSFEDTQFEIAAGATLTINAGGGADDLTIDGVAFDGNLTINAADDLVSFSGTATDLGTGNLTVDAMTVNVATAVSTSGAGAIDIEASRNIVITNSGGVSGLTAEDGDIVLLANDGGTSPGTFDGIFIDDGGAIENTGSGGITLTGTGGTAGTSTRGIFISGTIISGNGAIHLTGTGGDGESGSGVFLVELLGAGAIISAGGAIHVTGNGGTGTHAYGATLNGSITSGGGAIDVTGNGGTGDISNGLFIGGTINSDGGPINVAGNGGDNGAGVFIIGGTINSGGGAVHVIADSMNFAAPDAINAGANTVTLWQETNGLNINLGGADVAGTLVLADAELDKITAGAIQIGNANSGDITISGAISPAGSSSLALTTGGEIVDGSAIGNDITVANLALVAGTGIGISGDFALETNVDSITANTATGNIVLIEADSAIIGAAGLNAGSVLVLEEGTFVSGGNNRIDADIVRVRGGATLDLDGFSDQIDQLTVYSGASNGALVTTGAGTLGVTSIVHVDAEGAAVGATIAGNLDFGGLQRTISLEDGLAAVDLTISAAVGDGGMVRETNDPFSTLVLSGTNIYTGETILNGGVTRIDGSTAAGSSVTVNSGAVLAGTGTVGGSVQVNSGGTIAPGASPGILGTGNITFAGGANFLIEIDGTTVGTQYDQLDVTGTVALAGATLTLGGAYIPQSGESITIIANDGTDPVTGNFDALTEGDTFIYNGVIMAITYLGGDGNDVVLTANTPPVADAGGAYTADEGEEFQLDGTGSSDPDGTIQTYEWDLDYDGTTFDVDASGDTPTVSFPDDFPTRTIALRVTDEEGGRDISTTTLTVNNVNPTAMISNNGPVDEGSPVIVSLNGGTDPSIDDAAGLHYFFSTDEATRNAATYAGSGTTPSQSLTFIDNGSYTVYARVLDDDGGYTDYETVVTVNNVAPSVTADKPALSVDEGQSISTTGTWSDPGDDIVSLTATTGTVTKNSDGTWSWSFDAVDGPDESATVTITATDSDGAETSTTFGLTVNNVAPSVTADEPALSVDEGQSVSTTGTWSDPGDDIVSLTASTGTVTQNSDGTWSWSFNAVDGPDESATVTITATDSDGAVSSTTFALVVNNIAPSVTANEPALSVDEGQSISTTGTWSDPGDDIVSLTASTGTVTQNDDGTWSWSFDAVDGPDESATVTITATDSDGAETSTTFGLTVNNVAPTTAINSIGKPRAVGAPIAVSGSATDPAGANDPLTFDWTITKNGNPYVTGQGADFSFTPDEIGDYVITLIVSDGDGGSNSVSESIRVSDTGLVVAPKAGRPPIVQVYDATGQHVRFSFYAYQITYLGGVKIATGDVNGDGVLDIITAPGGDNVGADIRVFDGVDGTMIHRFFAFAPSFHGGFNVASGDVDGDGFDDIIVSVDSGWKSAVIAFDGQTTQRIGGFFAYGNYDGGVNIAAGDVNGDGIDEILTVPGGTGVYAHVKAFRANGQIVSQFVAYPAHFHKGTFNIAAGDVTGDGIDDVIVSVGSVMPPWIRVFNGATPQVLTSILAYPARFRGGVSIGTGDVNLDGRADILTSTASGTLPYLGAFDGLSGQLLAAPPNPFGNFRGGTYVSGNLYNDDTQFLRLDGEVIANSNAASPLETTQVEGLLAAAAGRFRAAGFSQAVTDQIAESDIRVADLAGGRLAMARPGAIVFDVNAAGWGWFIDETPTLDDEFTRNDEGAYRAVADSAAEGKVDLLTVLTHEIAHELGFDDLDPTVHGNSLLTATLPTGARRATREHFDDLFADGELMDALLTV